MPDIQGTGNQRKRLLHFSQLPSLQGFLFSALQPKRDKSPDRKLSITR